MDSSSDKPLPQFSEYLFWDIDKSKLDYQRDAKYVIDRIVLKGKLDDWFSLLEYYGAEKIQEVTTETRYLDKYSLSYLSVFFNIAKENFRCYKFIQLNQGLWPY